jgi:hypothetical protein
MPTRPLEGKAPAKDVRKRSLVSVDERVEHAHPAESADRSAK